jgi:hypothetical protein
MGDRSVDARDISQSVVVTGDGNNVALTFGDTGIRLPLRRKQLPPRSGSLLGLVGHGLPLMLGISL